MKKLVAALSIGMLLGPLAAFTHAAKAPKVLKICKSCHKLTKDHTRWSIGPGLKGIGKRVSREYLEKMLTDPRATVEAGGPEVEVLKKGARFKAKLRMPKVVKKLSREDVRALLDYLTGL